MTITRKQMMEWLQGDIKKWDAFTSSGASPMLHAILAELSKKGMPTTDWLTHFISARGKGKHFDVEDIEDAFRAGQNVRIEGIERNKPSGNELPEGVVEVRMVVGGWGKNQEVACWPDEGDETLSMRDVALDAIKRIS